jgi:predicted double-glycine peptidase
VDLFAPGELRPKEALRFAFVREQGFDRSCGYSAAASLMSLYWKLPLAEGDLIERYAGGKVESGRLDVSFADLARLFADYGFSVKGVRMGWDQLASALELFAPIIVHYESPDRHFALALRVREGWIITLDPAMGCELMRREQFMERWSGAALVALSASATRDAALLDEAVRVAWDRHELLERLER